MIFYRYTVREHIIPFLYSFGIIVFFLVMQLAVQLLEKIIRKGLAPLVVLELFLIQLGWIVALAIPMAILVATLTTFGRMSGDNEILAIKASGRNLYSLITPVFAGSAVLAVLLVFFNNLILPEANHRAANLASDISRKKPAAFIDPNVLIKDFKDYVLYVNKVNPRSGRLEGVKIFSDIPGQDPSTTVADSGRVSMTFDERYLRLTLYNGETHSISTENREEHFLGRFEKQVVFIQNVDSELRRTESAYRGDREKSAQVMLGDVAEFKQRKNTNVAKANESIDSLKAGITALAKRMTAIEVPRDTTGAAQPGDFEQWAAPLLAARTRALAAVKREERNLARVVRRVDAEERRISQYLVEVHKKYSIPVTCIVFVLIGAPLGIMARRGGLAVGATYGLFFFVLFWVFLIGGETLADRMVVSPAVAMWSGNVIVGLCGVLLIVRMVKETTFISLAPLIELWHHLVKGLHRIWGGGGGRVARALWAAVRFVYTLPFRVLQKIIRILPAYLIRKFAGHLIGELVALVVVFIVVDFISNLKRFEAAPFWMVAAYYWYYLPWVVVTVLPIVVLLASMFSVGSMAKHSELTAMRGAGINIRQLTVPLLMLGILISVGSFYFGEKVLPDANRRRQELKEDLKEGRIEARTGRTRRSREFRRNFYYFGDDQTIYCFEEFRTNPQKTKNVWRESFKDNRIIQRIEAHSLDYIDSTWYFVNGSVRNFFVDSSSVSRFDTLRDTVLHATPDAMVVRIKSKEEMSYWELQDYIDKVKRQGEDVSSYKADLYFKLALPAMSLVVILLGISITAKMGRKGGALLFGIGLMMTFTYWIMSQFGLAFAQNGQLHPLAGAWFGNAVFFVVGLALYKRAIR